MGRFCVQCGAEDRRFIHGLCEGCYWKSVEGTPREVGVVFCRACFSHLRGKRWVARRGRDLDEVVIDAAREELLRQTELPEGVEVAGIRGEVLERNPNRGEGGDGSGGGLPARIALTITLRERESGTIREERSEAYVDYRLCQPCGCVVRGRYDAMVQIRAEGRILDAKDNGLVGKVFDDFYRETSGRQEVVEVKEHEGGIDVKFASLNAARLFVKMLQEATGASVSDSPKIVGTDKRTGARVYRTTYAVRFPRLREGDIIEAEGRAYLILGYHRGNAVVRDLEEAGRLGTVGGTGRGRGRKTLPPHAMASAEKVAAERVRRVRVEAKAETFATLLDLTGKYFLDIPSERLPLDMDVGDTGLLISVGGREVLYREDGERR